MRNDRPAGLWPKAIVGLILFFLLLTGWSIQRAVTGVSAVTNPRYYSHGLKYNRTLVEKEAAAALGWGLETSLHDGQLTLVLRDGGKRAVTGARARLTLFGAEDDGDRVLELDESLPGRYVAELPEGLDRQISARLLVRRNGASMIRSLLLNL